MHIALPRVALELLIVRNNVNSSNVFMKYIDAVSLYLLYCATKSRQNNSAFFVEACISKIIEFAVMPVPGVSFMNFLQLVLHSIYREK